jgi:hypothetical protein
MIGRTLLLIITLAGSLVLGQSAPAPANSQRAGLALVIGNSRYIDAELPTVHRDKRSMAAALTSLGFVVREVEDLQRPRDFEEELASFLRNENAVPEDVLVVYYSGHGLQIDGRACLLGTAVTGSGEMSSGLRSYSIGVNRIIEMMEQAAPSARILIVDACRNNAFAVAPRKAGVALQVDIEDTYVLFADEPGKTIPARSDSSLESPFTAGLLFAMENSDEGIEKRFEVARTKTRDLSPEQNPQILSSRKSAARTKPFLDRGAKAKPAQSAGQMLNEAESLYASGSWKEFQARVQSARILSSSPDLTERLAKELEFSKLVLAAQAAKDAPGEPKWADAAAAFERAGRIFPTRAWTLESAALCWLLADRIPEAVSILGRLRSYPDSPLVERTARLASALVQADPSLESAFKSLANDGEPISGPEFAKYPIPHEN